MGGRIERVHIDFSLFEPLTGQFAVICCVGRFHFSYYGVQDDHFLFSIGAVVQYTSASNYFVLRKKQNQIPIASIYIPVFVVRILGSEIVRHIFD